MSLVLHTTLCTLIASSAAHGSGKGRLIRQESLSLEAEEANKHATRPACDFPQVLAGTSANQPKWVVLVGESNMRHTYYWWVSQVLAKTEGATLLHSNEFGLDRTDLPYGGRWSDQEAVVQFSNGGETRVSFRFLHGGMDEIKGKFADWHVAARASYAPVQLGLKLDERNTWIEPSAFARWATQHNVQIDFSQESPDFAKVLSKYAGRQPDAVVLTEGWGGMPDGNHTTETVEMFRSQSTVQFVWAPIFVTSRKPSRHQEFMTAVRGIPSEGLTASGDPDSFNANSSNCHILDMWSLAKTLPPESDQDLLHISVGGRYMQDASARLFEPLCLQMLRG